MVFITTLNNISIISWRAGLLVEETGEYHRPVASHILLYRVHLVMSEVRTHTSQSVLMEYQTENIFDNFNENLFSSYICVLRVLILTWFLRFYY